MDVIVPKHSRLRDGVAKMMKHEIPGWVRIIESDFLPENMFCVDDGTSLVFWARKEDGWYKSKPIKKPTLTGLFHNRPTFDFTEKRNAKKQD